MEEKEQFPCWRDISSAPSEEMILCAYDMGTEGKDWDIVILWWDDHYETWTNGEEAGFEPTHWMWLPEFPK